MLAGLGIVMLHVMSEKPTLGSRFVMVQCPGAVVTAMLCQTLSSFVFIIPYSFVFICARYCLCMSLLYSGPRRNVYRTSSTVVTNG